MGTPHPKSSTAITFRSNTDDDDNDDIRCRQCEDPIAYCHCQPLPMRPRVVPIADTNRGGAAPAFPRRSAWGQLYCMTGPKPKTSRTTTSITGVEKKKTTKKPRFPTKERRVRQGKWYLTEDEEGYRRRVTQEEEFRLIAQGQAPPPRVAKESALAHLHRMVTW